MPDEPLYDPDWMTFEDLDMTDPAVVEAYLNHPVTNALFADEVRAIQQLPAGEQRPEFEFGLRNAQKMRARLIELRDSLNLADPQRTAIESTIAKAEASIEVNTLRLLELDDEE